MSPSKLDEKLTRLSELASSHDPVLEREAKVAIKALLPPGSNLF
jgi:hypothetical protein